MPNVNFHVVLVGLPGAGKSAVGKIVAKMMNVKFVDIDELIEEREGVSVADIFSGRGEAEFRQLERLATEHAICEPAAVIAPGGGWAAEDNNLERLPDHTLTVYLKTMPHTAAVRLSGSRNRPLLNGPDIETRMIDLLTVRRSYYEKCKATVSTDGRTADEVADAIVELARVATGG